MPAATQLPPPGKLNIDHVAHFVPHIDAASTALARAGFTLTPFSEQAHRLEPGGPLVPAGSGNRCVMLREGYLEFLTRIAPGNRLGDVKRGSRITMQGPFGSFIFPETPAERSFLFVAGGTGIAPLRSMIRQAVLSGQKGKLRLLYSARTPADFAYLPELRKLARDKKLVLAITATREVAARWRSDNIGWRRHPDGGCRGRTRS